MSTKNPMKLMYKLVFLFVWFALSSIAVIFAGQVNQRDYDPHLIMAQAIMDSEYESVLKDELELLGVTKNTLVHITSKSFCYCDFLAKAHQSKLDAQIENSMIKTVYIKTDSDAVLSKFIPSSPSVVYIDDNGSIAYVGPYAVGAGCYSAHGEIDKILDSYLKDKATPVRIRNEASGCYCSFSASSS